MTEPRRRGGAGWSVAGALGLALLATLAAAHQALLWEWLVEDAAISFTYARNLVNGHGLVHYPGAEPVEGYSNPTWVALLALLFVSGVDHFDLARGLGMVTGTAAVVVAGLLARRLAGPGPGATPAALLAAGLLAASTHHATWSASGLENPLFTLLLLAGGLALVAGRDAAAGLLFALLGMTRPEGAMYGLLAGGWLLLAGPRRLLRWAPTFLLPLLCFEAARLWYFAWPLPNTYYAKAGHGGILDRLDPTSPGMRYLLRHLREHALPWLLPAALLGLWGRGPRLLLLGWAAAAAFFTAWSGGDWMKGARWLSMLVPPLCVLGGLGLARLAPRRGLSRWGGLALAAALAVAWAAPQVRATQAYARKPETSPMSVRPRMIHARDIQGDLLLERPTWLDIDMGATTTWSGMVVVDYGRLLDVPMAHHRYRPDVLEEHLTRWHRIDLAHLHGRWAQRTRLAEQPWWRQEMIEVAGYPLKRPEDDRHGGIWVRREHLAPPAWQRTGEALAAAPPAGPGLVFVAAQVGADRVGAGRTFLVDVGLAAVAEVDGPRVIRVELVDTAGAAVESWRVEAGRAWFPAPRWRRGETVRTRGVFRTDPDRAPGAYRLRAGVEGGPWTDLGTLEVLAPAQADAALEEARAAVEEVARSGRCDEAIGAWEGLRLRTPRDGSATAASRRRVAAAVGACLRARMDADPARIAQDLPLLVAWQPQAPQTRARVRQHADRWWDQAEAARRAGDAAGATARYDLLLRVDPTRTWARRRKEELRADGPVSPVPAHSASSP
ncbi:hypothetical protein L6R53_12745 [Myxococcota bacterium]|nr:hypothetical protein [Myxococcota bacterium]